MASFNLDESSKLQPLESKGGSDSHSSGNCSRGLGLLVWLGQLARDESARGPVKPGIAESLDRPRVLGRFRLEALLGAGAYGAVFRALDTHLGRRVALKLAWPGVLMDPVSSRRFVEEPKTVAALKHRGIVEVYDSGEIEMACFIALELVEGPTLAQWLKDKEHVGVRLAAQIVRSVAEAIHFAHERGIIHRDLKPSNILLRPTGRDCEFPYEPVVTDFGLARGPRLSEMSMLTATQAIIGTDHYMSPEQAAGRQGEIGPASDIFSLGVVLYELVAGRRPFEGESSGQIRQRIQEDEPPAIHPWRKSVPRDLETISLKCLEKSPSRRYSSAQELADDLGRFLDNEPIRALPTTVWQRGWKFAKRKPLLVSLVSLAAASVLLITALLGAWAADRISATEQLAVAHTAADVADGSERQHQYASNIQHAADAIRRSGRREVLELLEQCRSLASRKPVRCGIEWDYLWAKANNAERTLDASEESIHVVRFSPDGNDMVSASEDGRVIFWDTQTWKKRSELDDGIGEVNVAEISADGSLLALGGDDGRVVVHRMSDGSVVYDEQVVDGRVFALVWLGESRRFAVGGEDAILSIIDPVSRERRQTHALPISPTIINRAIGRGHEIGCLAYVPDRNLVIAGVTPSEVHIIDASSLDVVRSWWGDLRGLRGFCYVPIGPGYLAAAGKEHLTIVEIENGTKVAECFVPHSVCSLRYSIAAGALVAGLADGWVQSWDAQDLLNSGHSSGQRFCAHSGRASTVEFSPSGKWLASGGEDGRIRLWNRRSMRDPFDVPMDQRPWLTEFSPCGRWLAVLDAAFGQFGTFVVFDVALGRRLWSSDAPKLGDWSLNNPDYLPERWIAFDPTGHKVVTIDADSCVRERELGTGRVVRNHSALSAERVSKIQFSPDGRFMIANGQVGNTLIVNRASGNVIERLANPAGRELLGIYRTRLGDHWLEMEAGRSIALCPAPKASAVLTLLGLSESIQVIRVSSDGRHLAAGGRDRVVYVWDLDKTGPPSKFIGHEGAILNLRFSGDGQTVLSHGTDGTVRFWHLATRTELIRLGTAEEPVLSMGLNAAGTLLVLGVEHDGRYGLQIHRLGPDRESLPKSFDIPAMP